MSIAEQIYNKAKVAGKVSDGSKYFAVTDKKKIMVEGQEVTVEKPNGDHVIEVKKEKLGTAKGYDGKEQNVLSLDILDNGLPKLWEIPLKNAE